MQPPKQYPLHLLLMTQIVPAGARKSGFLKAKRSSLPHRQRQFPRHFPWSRSSTMQSNRKMSQTWPIRTSCPRNSRALAGAFLFQQPPHCPFTATSKCVVLFVLALLPDYRVRICGAVAVTILTLRSRTRILSCESLEDLRCEVRPLSGAVPKVVCLSVRALGKKSHCRWEGGCCRQVKPDSSVRLRK